MKKRTKKQALLELKKYFEEMKETCEKMIEIADRKLKKIEKKKTILP